MTLAGVAADVLSQNDTHVIVQANAPASLGSIVGDVVVTTNTGVSTTRINGWTYAAASDMHTIQPSSGQAGTTVTITGVSLLAG